MGNRDIGEWDFKNIVITYEDFSVDVYQRVHFIFIECGYRGNMSSRDDMYLIGVTREVGNIRHEMPILTYDSSLITE